MEDDRVEIYEFIMQLNKEQIAKMINLLGDDFKEFKKIMLDKLNNNS